ncbi:MAG: ribosome silencing factor [Spirochaetota bacterium]
MKKAVRTLDEHKGRDIVCLDLTGIHSYLENFVIVTGSSRIHCRALARAVSDLCTELGREKKNIPSDPGGWIVLDYGDIVFHIFIEEQRDYYNLERLWSDAERVDIGIEPGRGYVQSL